VKLFTKQTQVLPEAPRSWSNLGGALLALGRYDEASKALQHSLSIEPSRGGYVNLGTCYFWLGRYADAAANYEKAAAIQPKQYVVWANLGDAYRWTPGQRAKSAGPYSKAINLAREALTVNPADVKARAVVAGCLAKTGDVTAAQSEINSALRLDPTNPKALYAAAVIANIRGDRDSARAWLQRALAAGASASDAKRDPELSSINKPQA
jgi:eukaryotic-like serine/threonine-protein kinase